MKYQENNEEIEEDNAAEKSIEHIDYNRIMVFQYFELYRLWNLEPQ